MGGVFNTVNLHLYHYAGNNPVKYTDPTGMSDEDVFDQLQNTINEIVNSYIDQIKHIVESSSLRGAINLFKGNYGPVNIS